MNDVLDIADEIAKDFEGLSLDPYHDPVGFPTYGYGHLLSRKKWADLTQWTSLPDEQAAIDLLWADMRSAYAGVTRLVTYPLEPVQTAALVDFAFNCGVGNLQVSTLRRVINRGDLDEAPKQFMRWVYADGVKLNGLVRRRGAEVDLWAAA